MVNVKKKGTESLLNLLKETTQSPEKHIGNKKLIQALKSQGGLANYENHTISKDKISLNTLKSRADEYLDGGFKILNDYRISALQSIQDKKESTNKSNTRTRAGLSKRVVELEDNVLVMQQISFTLIQGITEAIDEIEALINISNSDVRERRAELAVAKLKSLLTINPQPFDKPIKIDNILEIGKGV